MAKQEDPESQTLNSKTEEEGYVLRPRHSCLICLIFVAATALVPLLPFLFLGIPSGHDFEFNLNGWMELASRWTQGIQYPHWAALAHFGYGEPRFIFYPPVSWILGTLLGSLLSWNIVPAAYIWIAITASGCSMFFLARRYLSYGDALFAACVYAVNPYNLVIVYWRSAYAELLAAAAFPLLLLILLRNKESGRSSILPLGLLIAAVWLIELPAAVILTYSLVLLAALNALIGRSPRLLFYVGVAAILGLALAGFYILPAAYEQKWVSIAQVVSPGVRPQDNFLFSIINDPMHNRFNRLVSTVACFELAVLAVFFSFSGKLRRRQSSLWWTIAIWSFAAAVMMFPLTSAAWEWIPKFRFIQFPWRCLLALSPGAALLCAVSVRRWTSRAAVGLGIAAVIVYCCYAIQPPWWESTDGIRDLEGDIRENRGYEGTYEYVPADADVDMIARDAPMVSFQGKGKTRIDIIKWSSEYRSFVADAGSEGSLVLHLFNYPAWRVEVNGNAVRSGTLDPTGQIVIPVRAGRNHVQISFARTWDRTAGFAISAAALLACIGLTILTKHKPGVPALRESDTPTNDS